MKSFLTVAALATAMLASCGGKSSTATENVDSTQTAPATTEQVEVKVDAPVNAQADSVQTTEKAKTGHEGHKH